MNSLHSIWNEKTVSIFLAFSSILVPFAFDSVIAVSSIIGSSYSDISFFQNALISGIYGAGLGLGTLLLGPLFDVRGRREVFIMGMVIVFVSSILSCFVVTINQLLITRFFQGFGVATQLIGARCIISDYFEDEQKLASAYSLIFISSFIAAVIAPLLSNFFISYDVFHLFGSKWKVIFIQLAFISFIIGLVLVFFPETAPLTGEEKYFTILFKYFNVFKNKKFFLYSLLNAIFAAFLYTYFLAISFVMQDLIKLDSSIYTKMLSINMIFGAIGSIINDKCLKRFSLSTMITFGYCILLASSIWLMCLTIKFDVASNVGNYYKAYLINISFLLIMMAYGVVCPNLIVKATSSVDPHLKGNAISALGIMQLIMGMFICNIIGYFATTYLSIKIISISFLILSIFSLIIDLYCKKNFEA